MTTVAERPDVRATVGRPVKAASPPSSHSFATVMRWQLRNARRAPLTWGVSLGALCALEVAIYPSMKDTLARTVADYPEPLREAFNITDIGTVEAFLDMEMFSLMLPLALAFLAIRSAIRGIVIAEESGWLDVMLAAPLSRRALTAGTVAATAVTLALVLAVIGVMIELAGVLAGETVGIVDLLAGLASMWALSMFFAGLAVLACGFLRRSVPVTAIAAGALVTMYVVDLVGKLSAGLADARYATVFRYLESAITEGLDIGAFIAVTLVGLGLAAVGALLFERRDVI